MLARSVESSTGVATAWGESPGDIFGQFFWKSSWSLVSAPLERSIGARFPVGGARGWSREARPGGVDTAAAKSGRKATRWTQSGTHRKSYLPGEYLSSLSTSYLRAGGGPEGARLPNDRMPQKLSCHRQAWEDPPSSVNCLHNEHDSLRLSPKLISRAYSLAMPTGGKPWPLSAKAAAAADMF
jgi:hypothetical protein